MRADSQVFSSQNDSYSVPTVLKLSFVSLANGCKDFWAIQHTGDWTIDCQIGRAAADELIALMRAEDVPIYVSSVARAIVAKGIWTGVEVGFFTGVGIYTIR